MLALFLFARIISSNYKKIPKIKSIYIYPEKTDSEIKNKTDKAQKEYDEAMSQCLEAYSRDFCEKTHSMLGCAIYTNKVNDELNKFLETIPTDIDIIIVGSYHFNGRVDFNNLPKKKNNDGFEYEW